MIEKVRAVLLTPDGMMLAIRRVWPGAAPFWVLPGGHVEPQDANLRAALEREVHEETCGKPRIVGLLWTLVDDHKRQHIYLAHIDSWSEEGRTGPEFGDPSRGEYRLEEIPLTAAGIDAITLVPEEVAEFLCEELRAGRDLADLADPLG
ncbi:MAG TPA: NUDIX domain-containing protein [Actinocrinis sp.]|nr:NUDIX domain-containing protein [Actinocrinis sp.]